MKKIIYQGDVILYVPRLGRTVKKGDEVEVNDITAKFLLEKEKDFVEKQEQGEEGGEING